MYVNYDMVIDFARPGKGNTLIISEGDAKSRKCHFVLLANKAPMDMMDVVVATARGIKEDGSQIFLDCEIVEDGDGNKLNEVILTLPAEFADEAGNVTATITLDAVDSSRITSFEFYIKVRNALYNEDDLISDDDLTGFRNLLDRCMAALQKMEIMTEQEALPNPYALTINLEGETITYNGNSAKEITLQELAYLGETISEEQETIDESAAGRAAQSASEAATSEYNALVAKNAAESAAESATEVAETAASNARAAAQSAGLAEGYATRAETVARTLNLPALPGDYRLHVTISGGEPTYSWISE